jgi:hypothetical protein
MKTNRSETERQRERQRARERQRDLFVYLLSVHSPAQ